MSRDYYEKAIYRNQVKKPFNLKQEAFDFLTHPPMIFLELTALTALGAYVKNGHVGVENHTKPAIEKHDETHAGTAQPGKGTLHTKSGNIHISQR